MASDHSRPSGVYGGLEAVAIGATASVQALLPAPPPVPEYVRAIQTAIAPPPAPPPAEAETQQLTDTEIQEQIALFIGIQEKTFEAPEKVVAAAPEPETPAAEQPTVFEYSFDNFYTLFTGGTESLVARAVGSAEGTRTPEGHKNPAYYGHVDPGNGVWNLGTFSYQHGAASPEEADDKQLRRLQTQTEILRQKALAHGLSLTKEELLNGIDLANQAPLAALDRGGYIDWLKEAHSLGMQGSEAIIWARTRSFIDPDTQRWNAPGLGNNIYSISHDQERRANAIARAIAAFNAQTQVAIAPAPVPNHDDIALNLELAAAPEPVIDTVPFAFNAFTSGDSTAETVAAASAQTAPTIPESARDNPEVVAMAAPDRDGMSLTSSNSQAQPEKGGTPKLAPRRLGRWGQAVTNFLTRLEDDSVSFAEDGPVAPAAIAEPLPTPAAALADLPALPAALTRPSVESEGNVATASAAIAATPDESLATADAPTDAEPEAASTPVATARLEAAISPPIEADHNSALSEPAPAAPVPEPTPIRFDPPTPVSQADSEVTFKASESLSTPNLDSLAAPKTATAPADETDAEAVKQRTLQSLDQLQSILRAEAATETNQPSGQPY
ncbi:hypothetical protein DYY88_04915 [Leptolyngbya iicbica LK]|uniref:Uncharacterized protein n=2 Tax=Cyanophyceae TaxID=3028117 RepID=A0A4Q7EH16_9CYAN|nr:hypothetical protein DYY88_04915 [Leptolyngbya sp. LK]